MKKFTLLAAAAAVAMGANAQNFVTADVTTTAAAAAHPELTKFYTILVDENTVSVLEQAGKVVEFIGAEGDYEGETLVNGFRPLQVWENTFVFGEGRGVGADGGTGYLKLEPTGETWWGGGFNVQEEGKLDLSGLSMETSRFHLAYKTLGTAPSSTQFNILNNAATGSKGSFAIGAAREDQGVAIVSIAPDVTDEWQAVDISFADLKKLSSTFNLDKINEFYGFTLSFNGGAEAGKDICIDSAFFYTPAATDAIEGVTVNENDIVVYGKVINVFGTNGIALYNLNGQLVKSTAGAALDANGVAAGVYVVKAGNVAKKVAL